MSWQHAPLRDWTITVTIGELVGFTVPATVAVLLHDGSGLPLLVAMVAAGAVEGALLGLSQARVLRGVLPRLDRHRWIGLTAGSTALVWLLGLAPSTFTEVWRSWPTALVGTLGAVGVLVMLLSIGTFQWLELRRHLQRSGVWVGVTALAWMLGLLTFMAVAAPLWHAGQPVVLMVLIGVLGGVVMALTMAFSTGLGLRGMLRGQVSGPARPAVASEQQWGARHDQGAALARPAGEHPPPP
ncbi:hypothetical protein [Nocardioides mesophilus]|uniref:Uncharacterized protein n=1 Tax=Nocardioides mesophilus TaxID=433659 RepID=A0A7G9REM8_9ACTN|nr:hypothetical protein [Nocardioides mesophilus]QNN54053.1 hypothetical protein H9L09_06645 [Nocardioides mesophilus]